MKNCIALMMIAFTLTMLAACCPVAGSPQQAFMYRGGPRRTGVYETQGVAELTGVKWKFKTEGAVWSSPVVAEGVVYFGSDDDHFYAVDAETGEERWKFETADDIRSSPAIADGVAYFGSYDGFLYAVDTQTGAEVWKYKMSLDGFYIRPTYDDYTSSPAVVDEVVYFGTLNPKRLFCAVDAKTGEEKWCFAPDVTEVVYAPPTLAGDTVYFGGTSGGIYALDVQTGQEKWRFKAGQSASYAAAIDDTGTLYFGSKDTNLYALDSQTGEEKWKTSLAAPSWVTGSPIIADGVVYTGSSDAQRMFAVTADTGDKVWEFTVSGYAWASPALADGIIYAGSGNGHLYAIDAPTGQELWHFEAGHAIYSSPVIADGTVYFGSIDGYLYALH